jgi:hypothetical protein
MITKSKKAPNTVFYVPNTIAGRRFLVEMKKHLNVGEFKVRLKGRHENRAEVSRRTGRDHAALRQTIPVKDSTYIAVYLDGRTTQRVSKDWLRNIYQRRVS